MLSNGPLNTSVNAVFTLRRMRSDKQAIVDRIDQRLVVIGKDWNWIGLKLAESPQNLNNWRYHRGVPAAKHHAVAELLGWTVEQLLDKPHEGSGWPFDSIPVNRIESLTPGQKMQIEGVLLDKLDELEMTGSGGSKKKSRADGQRSNPSQSNARPVRHGKASS
jgi:hypothetical protein